MRQIDLISNEWSDLLFENRNKEYGAYVLRQQTGNRNLASIVAILVMVAGAVGLLIAKNKYEEYHVKVVPVYDQGMEVRSIKDKAPEVKRREPVKVEEVEIVDKQIINSIKFVAPKIVEDDKVRPEDQMRTQDELMKSKVAIGFADVIGNSESGEVLKAKEALVTEEIKPKEADLNKPFTVVEQMPSFPGGTAALMKFLGKQIKYPSVAEEMGIQGRVVCSVIVERDGSVTDIHVVKSVDPSLDKEAQRVIAAMPKWIPGRQNGQTVRVKYSLPVAFRLQ